MSGLPTSYNTLTLPQVRLSHHPVSSPTPTPVIIMAPDRPTAHNALTDSMASSVVCACALLWADPRVKCIVLMSSDPENRTFCADMDHHQRVRLRGTTHDEHCDTGSVVALAMHNCAKPIVAAINGPASVRVVSRAAKVGPVSGRRVSTWRPARLYICLASLAPGPRCTSEIVEAEQILPRALIIAEDIAANVSTVAIRVMRDMILRSPQSPEEAYLLESKVFFDMLNRKDSKEGKDSFLQKCAPHFDGTMGKDAPSSYLWWEEKDVKAKIRAEIKSPIGERIKCLSKHSLELPSLVPP
ncbi:putative enoyl-CoA hydratase/isomerase [Colletotrichum sublineola]|uniref:Putative enoyl-CoA hydratase/isomerase n=1 Tax=Colletotrichum sublineola TaxID=1173701 RepID=A0A066XDA6_COLSU|nr:putative enoyl-CoA hydratase/isomerase [Colletotrichum sublineola]